jgi:hypothetical protein
MAEWPTLTALKARLDVESTDFDDDLTRLLAACIAETKRVGVGDWVEGVDVPTDALSQSALELAVAYGATGEGIEPVKARRLRAGHRRRFTFA